MQEKCAAHLQSAPLLVDEQRQHRAWYDNEHDPEGVLLLVICVAHDPVEPHEVDDREGGPQEHQLHDGVVPVPTEQEISAMFCLHATQTIKQSCLMCISMLAHNCCDIKLLKVSTCSASQVLVSTHSECGNSNSSKSSGLLEGACAQGNEAGEEVQVPEEENERIQVLCLQRDPCARMRPVSVLKQQQSALDGPPITHA